MSSSVDSVSSDSVSADSVSVFSSVDPVSMSSSDVSTSSFFDSSVDSVSIFVSGVSASVVSGSSFVSPVEAATDSMPAAYATCTCENKIATHSIAAIILFLILLFFFISRPLIFCLFSRLSSRYIALSYTHFTKPYLNPV